MSTATLDRSLVERLVREALRGRLGNGHAPPSPPTPRPPEGGEGSKKAGSLPTWNPPAACARMR
jgi:hypothetical protein